MLAGRSAEAGCRITDRVTALQVTDNDPEDGDALRLEIRRVHATEPPPGPHMRRSATTEDPVVAVQPVPGHVCAVSVDSTPDLVTGLTSR